MENTELSESTAQKYLFRVPMSLCTELKVTLHDARSSPKNFLSFPRKTYAGFTDFIVCHSGCIISLIEVKVFFNNAKYLPQLIVSNQALSAGINGRWDISKLLSSKASHVSAVLWNGFQMLRCETAPTLGSKKQSRIIMDATSLDSAQALQGLWQLLERGIQKIGLEGDMKELSLEGDKNDKSKEERGGSGGKDDGKGRGSRAKIQAISNL